ncbi:MAG: hypothetical protein NTW07_10220 [candidate division Zixibacteria bacterium]|nr:hypothetical protein [candidate division Zixibacteria bacterium]
MKPTKRLLPISGLVMLTTISAISADTINHGEFRKTENRTQPTYQVGMLAGFRLDDLDRYTYVPSVGGDFYYFFRPTMALKAGFAHNSLTKLTPGTSYHTFVGEVGLRVNTSQTPVVPFLETGLSFPYHWGVNRGYGYVDFQPGVRVGAGLAWRVSEKLAFDFSVNQIINSWHSRDVELTAPAPCPLGMDCPPLRQEPDGAYNPTLLELAARFGL